MDHIANLPVGFRDSFGETLEFSFRNFGVTLDIFGNCSFNISGVILENFGNYPFGISGIIMGKFRDSSFSISGAIWETFVNYPFRISEVIVGNFGNSAFGISGVQLGNFEKFGIRFLNILTIEPKMDFVLKCQCENYQFSFGQIFARINSVDLELQIFHGRIEVF